MKHKQTRIQSHVNSRKHTYTQTNIHIHTHAYIQTNKYTHTNKHTVNPQLSNPHPSIPSIIWNRIWKIFKQIKIKRLRYSNRTVKYSNKAVNRTRLCVTYPHMYLRIYHSLGKIWCEKIFDGRQVWWKLNTQKFSYHKEIEKL